MDEAQGDATREDATREDPQGEEQAGFFARWIVPALFVVVVVAVFWFVGRMSMPVLGPESEPLEEEHFSGGCAFCHRSEADFDPYTLLE